MIEPPARTAEPGFRAPQQERSRETLRAMVEAIADLLAEKSSERISVQEMVERAETSVGAFYARFADKDAAVRYTQDEFWAGIRARWDRALEPGRWAGARPVAILAGVIRTFTWLMVRDRRWLRGFLREALGTPGAAIVERIHALDRHIAARMAALLAARAAACGSAVPAGAAGDGFLRVLSAVRDFVLFRPDEAPTRREVERLVLTLTRMYGGTLELAPLPRSYAELRALCARDGPGPLS